MLGMDGKPLPKIGDEFVFPLDKKLVSFCWVVRATKPEYRYNNKGKAITIPDMVLACARWVGTSDPTADDIAARKVLMLGREPCIRLDSSSPPRGFRKVGTVKKPAVGAKDGHDYSGFKGLQRAARRQWLQDHDRRRLYAEDQAEREREAAEDDDDKAIEALVKVRKRATAATIARIDLLPDWAGEKKHRTLLEKHLRELVKRLRAAKTKPAKQAAITTVVEAINKWNDRALVIETAEREALATAIDDIGRAFGLRGTDLAGDTRDW
jgi:hypothetical protein